MNIHPIFVHFPVALLTVYALMELVRFNKVKQQPYWFYVKALFLMIGGLGALAARQTGEMAVEGITEASKILEQHENFANATTAIFGILAACYLIVWLNRENITRFFINNNFVFKLWNFLVSIAKFVVESKLVIILAFAGLICVTITGGLGGRMVYGSEADPFLKPVLDFLLK